MIEVLAAFGLAGATGLNAYLPLLIVGLLARYTDLITLQAPWNALESPWVLGVLVVLLAIVAAIIVRIVIAAQLEPTPTLEFAGLVITWFLVINISLFIFNLFPIPPLDGSKVLFAFLPARTVWRVRPLLEQWGFVILLAVMFLPPGGDSIGSRILVPVFDAIFTLLVGA